MEAQCTCLPSTGHLVPNTSQNLGWNGHCQTHCHLTSRGWNTKHSSSHLMRQHKWMFWRLGVWKLVEFCFIAFAFSLPNICEAKAGTDEKISSIGKDLLQTEAKILISFSLPDCPPPPQHLQCQSWSIDANNYYNVLKGVWRVGRKGKPVMKHCLWLFNIKCPFFLVCHARMVMKGQVDHWSVFHILLKSTHFCEFSIHLIKCIH